MQSSRAREQAARRRLAALDGRSEEALWTELVRALCRHRFESFSNKVLTQLEGAGASGAIAPGRGPLAMCAALHGLQLPGGVGGSASASTLWSTHAFLERVSRLLWTRQMRGLHRPICEALGSALLEQQLAAGAATLATASSSTDGEAPPPDSLAERSAPATSAATEQLHKLLLQLATWATTRVGMPRSLTARFESWAAPLATSLLCMAVSNAPNGGAPEAELELHSRLLRRLLRCVRQPEHAHRVVALRCLRLQLPLLIATRGASKEWLSPVDQLFAGRAIAMSLELSRERDVPLILRRSVPRLHYPAHARGVACV